jgi:hypothetical protein
MADHGAAVPNGSWSKTLSASDLLKLRLDGRAPSNVVDGDNLAKLLLYADTAGTDPATNAVKKPGDVGWVVGLWRAKDVADQHKFSLQTGWPAVVADLKLGSGDVVELQPDGRDTRPDGSTRPRLRLRVQRAQGRQPVPVTTFTAFSVVTQRPWQQPRQQTRGMPDLIMYPLASAPVPWTSMPRL